MKRFANGLWAMLGTGLMASAPLAAAQTYRMSGTEWDVSQEELPAVELQPDTVYVATCRMSHKTERNVRGSLLLSIGDYGMGWTPLGNNHATVDFAEAFLTGSGDDKNHLFTP